MTYIVSGGELHSTHELAPHLRIRRCRHRQGPFNLGRSRPSPHTRTMTCAVIQLHTARLLFKKLDIGFNLLERTIAETDKRPRNMLHRCFGQVSWLSGGEASTCNTMWRVTIATCIGVICRCLAIPALH